jgi:FAD/FMN-containing dehydrogenase
MARYLLAAALDRAAAARRRRRPTRPGAGALATLDAAFMPFGAGVPGGPDVAAAMEARLGTLFERLRPWDTGRVYANFAKGPADPRDFFPPATYRRLQRVKAEVDPDGLFLAIHPLPARAT